MILGKNGPSPTIWTAPGYGPLQVRPKQPYINWANSFDYGGPEYDPDHHQAKVFLIDEVTDTRDTKKVVRRLWPAIFEEELNS